MIFGERPARSSHNASVPVDEEALATAGKTRQAETPAPLPELFYGLITAHRVE